MIPHFIKSSRQSLCSEPLKNMFRFTRATIGKLRACRFSTAASIPHPILRPEILCSEIFINNKWHKSKSGETFDVINPTTGEAITKIQRGSKEDINLAVNAAKEAFKLNSPWRTMNASERGRLLYKLSDLIERDAAYLASLVTTENGKPYQLSYFVDIQMGIEVLRYMAGWADKSCGKTIPINGPYLCYTRHEPVGVCGVIIPWNVPLLMTAWKIGPALAMGNTIVLKPAEQTPLTALYIAQLCKEVGIPDGVINIVPGFGDAGEALANNPKVNKIAFTGSTEVGLKIQQAAGIHNLKRTTLELGGKSPCVILADSNIEEAVEIAHQGLFPNQGQICCAASRTFIEASIYDEFVERSVERANKRIVGDPFNDETEQGPQIDEAQMNKVLDLIKEGIRDGAKLVAGGNRIGDKGYFVQPTVFSNVEDNHVIAREEIFGPVQQLIKFKSLDEIIERANNTTYGLAAGILSNDLDKVNYLVQGLQAGTVWINCYNVFSPQQPFGGFKNSGLGRELSEYGLQQYTEVKNVVTKLTQKNS